MADGTSIEWSEATWNPITGCSVLSSGCTNCYAMRLAGTRLRHEPSRQGLTNPSAAGPVWNGQVRLNEQWLDQPLRWRRPRRIFVCAHGDLFHDAVPDEWIDKVFAVMALSPHHTFQVLTKRARRMRRYVDRMSRHLIAHQAKSFSGKAHPGGHDCDPDVCNMAFPLPNVWLGVSAENQVTFDERVTELLAVPAAVRWVSLEPLLGAINARRMRVGDMTRLDALTGVYSASEQLAPPAPTAKLDWVVVGGESGRGARPMHPAWVRSLRDQCAATATPFFFKQWGHWGPVERDEKTYWLSGGRKIVSRLDVVGVPNSEVGKLYTCGTSRLAIERAVDESSALAQPLEPLGKRFTGRLLDGARHDAYPHACSGVA